jgi:hypothetical protein
VKPHAEIRDDVIQELRWDLQISQPDAIGVAVMDGAVTLTGHVSTYAEKLAAARAAERVYGVKAIANDLRVSCPAHPGTAPISPTRSRTEPGYFRAELTTSVHSWRARMTQPAVSAARTRAAAAALRLPARAAASRHTVSLIDRLESRSTR